MKRKGYPLLVAILSGLVAAGGSVAYGIVAMGQLPDPNAPPTVLLGPAVDVELRVKVPVESAEPRRHLGDFRAEVRFNRSTFVVASLLGNTLGPLTYADLDADVRLSAGDRFSIEASLPGSFELLLFWREAEVGRATVAD